MTLGTNAQIYAVHWIVHAARQEVLKFLLETMQAQPEDA